MYNVTHICEFKMKTSLQVLQTPWMKEGTSTWWTNSVTQIWTLTMRNRGDCRQWNFCEMKLILIRLLRPTKSVGIVWKWERICVCVLFVCLFVCLFADARASFVTGFFCVNVFTCDRGTCFVWMCYTWQRDMFWMTYQWIYERQHFSGRHIQEYYENAWECVCLRDMFRNIV